LAVNVVASILSEALGAVDGDDSDDEDEEGLNGAGPAGSEDEEKQLQNMMFNLMMGNQDGFNDIDSQRKSENSYRFSLDEQIKRQEEMIAKEESMKSSTASDQQLHAEALPPAENDINVEVPDN
jgi:hypothetical protein